MFITISECEKKSIINRVKNRKNREKIGKIGDGARFNYPHPFTP